MDASQFACFANCEKCTIDIWLRTYAGFMPQQQLLIMHTEDRLH